MLNPMKSMKSDSDFDTKDVIYAAGQQTYASCQLYR